MKKIITAICALGFATTLAIPAQANNNQDVVIGVLGGALGGLVLGEVLRPRYPAYPVYAAPPPPVYVQPQVEYVRECWWKTVRRYNPNTGTYVRVKKKVCDYVPY
jgi:hypothetical protein